MHFRNKFGKTTAAALALVAAGASTAQLLPPLPPVGDVAGSVAGIGIDAVDDATRQVDQIGQGARALAAARLERLRGVVQANPQHLEMTDLGPAVRAEIIAVDPEEATLAAARSRGFVTLARERINGVDIDIVTLAPPKAQSVDRALRQLRRLFPGERFSANHLHFPSGPSTVAAVVTPASPVQEGAPAAPIGIIDGGVAAHPALRGLAEQRGFVRGAPVASAHGTAMASLAAGSGSVRGAAPGAHLFIADVYGRDPAGGSATAIARALGWMAAQGVPVVAVSLVGPPNALVDRAVSSARARGIQIVAAVGNDGPSAPPAYPASYPGVIAVTGVDGRNRALPEAGRASHLDYSAPGADMAAAAPGGRLVRVRGTSYAVPLVAGRMALALGRGASPIRTLDAEAQDLGPRGADKSYGRGLICGVCRSLFKKKMAGPGIKRRCSPVCRTRTSRPRALNGEGLVS